MSEDKPQVKPTKKWIEEQMAYHKAQIIANQGALNLLDAMLKGNVYADDEVKQIGA